MKSASGLRQISPNLFLRPLLETDAQALALLADDRSVWENLRDSMPQPYTDADARDYIDQCSEEQPPRSFGIFWNGALAGMAGLIPGRDVNRITGEVGYWVGQPYRGQGLATATLRELMRYAWEEFGFFKLSACVFEGNTASVRVLEKCGFRQEAVLEGNALKAGIIRDEWRFCTFNPDFNPARFSAVRSFRK